MKAIIQYEFGDASVFKYEDIKTPQVAAGECLIEVAYTSVNYADIKARTGQKDQGKFPMTVGLDVAGTIVKTSANSKFAVGDRVIAFPKGGSYKQYVVAKEALIFNIPPSLSFEVAATIPTVSILSYMLLHKIAQVKASDTIVIHSAAGGVGSMLVQLAKLAGVEKIIATVGHLSKADYVKQLGADIVCTYESFVEEVLHATEQRGANLIFDSVAGEVSTKSLQCLALFGTLVQFGNSSGTAGHFTTTDVHSSCRNIKGFSLGTTRKHEPHLLAPIAESVIQLVDSKQIALPVTHIFDLQDATKAHQLIESRQYVGKVLLKI